MVDSRLYSTTSPRMPSTSIQSPTEKLLAPVRKAKPLTHMMSSFGGEHHRDNDRSQRQQQVLHLAEPQHEQREEQQQVEGAAGVEELATLAPSRTFTAADHAAGRLAPASTSTASRMDTPMRSKVWLWVMSVSKVMGRGVAKTGAAKDGVGAPYRARAGKCNVHANVMNPPAGKAPGRFRGGEVSAERLHDGALQGPGCGKL